MRPARRTTKLRNGLSLNFLFLNFVLNLRPKPQAGPTAYYMVRLGLQKKTRVLLLANLCIINLNLCSSYAGIWNLPEISGKAAE